MTRRLVISYIALAFILLTALEVPLGILDAKRERALAAEAAEREAAALALSAGPALAAGQLSGLEALTRRYRARTGGEISVSDRTGRPVASSSGDADRDAEGGSRSMVDAALAGRTVDSFGADEGRLWLRAAVPVYAGDQVTGTVLLGVPAGSTERRVHTIWITLAAVEALLVGVAALVGWLMARSLARPLGRLEKTAAAFAGGELGARAQPAGPPELRDLAREFNRIGDHLRELLGAQERFVAEASHQLRSPLTALRLRLENLEADLDGDHAHEMAAARREIGRLSRIVDGLLALGRVERETPPGVPVDVGAVIEDRCDAWTALAEERDVELRSDARLPAGRRARLVPGDLEQILDNLVANALDALGTGGHVTVAAAEEPDGSWRVEVCDNGPGMTPEERDRAFDRFWRGADAARGRSGLGLAIVRQLAVRNGARAELRPVDPRGTCAVIVLPPDAVVSLLSGKEKTKLR